MAPSYHLRILPISPHGYPNLAAWLCQVTQCPSGSATTERMEAT